MTTVLIRVREDDIATFYITDDPFTKYVEVPPEFLERFRKAEKEFDEVQILMSQYLEGAT